jgi:hypothetical protein
MNNVIILYKVQNSESINIKPYSFKITFSRKFYF